MKESLRGSQIRRRASSTGHGEGRVILRIDAECAPVPMEKGALARREPCGLTGSSLSTTWSIMKRKNI